MHALPVSRLLRSPASCLLRPPPQLSLLLPACYSCCRSPPRLHVVIAHLLAFARLLLTSSGSIAPLAHIARFARHSPTAGLAHLARRLPARRSPASLAHLLRSLTCFARLTTAACLRSVIHSGSSQLGGGSHTDAHTRRISSSAAPCPALHANLFTVFWGIGIRRKKSAVTSPNVGFLDPILAPILAIWPQYWPFGPNIGHLAPILVIWPQYWSQ